MKLADLELQRHQGTQRAVEEQQVDEVLLAGDLQPELAADEREAATHLAQEGLDLGQDCRLELALAVLVAQLEEVGSAPGGTGGEM